MLVKIELDLKDEAQMDAFLEILALLKKQGFWAGGSDTLRKLAPVATGEETACDRKREGMSCIFKEKHWGDCAFAPSSTK